MKIHNDFTLYFRVVPSGKRVVYYYAYDEDGKRLNGKSTGESTLTAARLKCNRLLKAGALVPKRGYIPTFTEYAVGWWDWEKCDYLKKRRKRSNLTKKYADNSRWIVDKALLPYFGNMRMDKITQEVVEAFVEPDDQKTRFRLGKTDAGRKKGETIRQGYKRPVFAWRNGGEIMAGTLAVTRATELHAEYKAWLEKMGFENVTITNLKNDALNTVICNKKPRLVIIDSWFYQDGTSRRIGELLKLFPKLNIAVVSLHDFPLSNAPWFIWEGAKSYIHLWEGLGEFKRGFQIVREGKAYIAPKVQNLIDRCEEWPDTKNKITKRQKECLVMLCCGLTADQIGEALYISRRTVYNHLNSLYTTFHVHNRTEMVALAWEMELVTTKDIQLYNRKKEHRRDRPVPQWAAVKRKCNRFMDYE